MMFSVTLDNVVKKLVDCILSSPVTHSADPATSPVGTMEHHVLEVEGAARFDVLKDLAAAPGRTIMFTRTKYGAKNLARKLAARGVTAVDLHGNLSQGARTRNLEAFSTGRDATLVCTDIAARGIHVDEVALVVHADPPVEHKAYLHRSGRTARAGEPGPRPQYPPAGVATSPVLPEPAPGGRTPTHGPRQADPADRERRSSGGRGRGRGRRSGGGRGQGRGRSRSAGRGGQSREGRPARSGGRRDSAPARYSTSSDGARSSEGSHSGLAAFSSGSNR